MAAKIPLSSANITFSPCGPDLEPPFSATLSAGYPLAPTRADAEAQIDSWADDLVAAGWHQSNLAPPTTGNPEELQRRPYMKNNLTLLLTPWSEDRSNTGWTFTLLAPCVVNEHDYNDPADSDVLAEILS